MCVCVLCVCVCVCVTLFMYIYANKYIFTTKNWNIKADDLSLDEPTSR